MFRLLALLLLALALLACRGEPRPQPITSTATTMPGDAAVGQTTGTAGAVPTVRGGIVRLGAFTGALTHDGTERSYRLFVPRAVMAGEMIPLVVGLHGGLGSGAQFASTTGFEAFAESEGFVAAFPDGVGRTWNGGRCCGQAARQAIDDVGFLAALIEKLADELPIDRERVFMAGHSNGAIMAWRFACERADLVAAIVPVAGSLEIPACTAADGVNLLAIHGDADQNHPIQGGRGARSIAGVDFTSVATSLLIWTSGMGCDNYPSAVVTEGALSTSSFARCRDGVTADSLVIAGADHPWPGSTVLAPQIQGEPSQAIDATLVAWEFFERVSGD
ncbi:MAG: alpha/beta hydrolase family esterase [Tepidiformaceae bacterium]